MGALWAMFLFFCFPVCVVENYYSWSGSAMNGKRLTWKEYSCVMIGREVNCSGRQR